jgi:hypothetical protein
MTTLTAKASREEDSEEDDDEGDEGNGRKLFDLDH